MVGQAGYDYGMEFKITALDVKVASAYREFMGVAECDIQSAHASTSVRLIPTDAAMAVYEEVARQVEAHSYLMSE